MSGSEFDLPEVEAAFARRVKELLDRGNEQLDARVRSRLTQARHRALEQASSPRGWSAHQWVPAAAGLAAAIVAAVLLWPVGGSRVPHPAGEWPAVIAEADFDDLEIVLAEESFELYEDLEFFQWLGSESESI